MTDADVLHIAAQAILISIKIAGPILAVTMGVGLFISLLQAATQVQEVTLTFVPKLAGVALVIVLAGSWMLQQLLSFTRDLFAMVPQLVG